MNTNDIKKRLLPSDPWRSCTPLHGVPGLHDTFLVIGKADDNHVRVGVIIEGSHTSVVITRENLLRFAERVREYHG